MSSPQGAPSTPMRDTKRLSGTLQPPSSARTARSVLTGNSFSTSIGKDKHAMTGGLMSNEFASDVGRRKFGFGHEELDDATAYYEGQFKLHMRWGDGTLHSPDIGAKYVGQFQNDKFHGDGEQVWADGSKYRGQWKNGQKHGNGEFTSAEQLTYVGQWEQGRRHGQGMQEYANRDRYEGWWFKGMCSGIGTYHFADGSRYEGAWANGRYDGGGVLSGCDGSRERQFYNNGLLVKREVLPPASCQSRPGTVGSRKNFLGGAVLYEQTRAEMLKPTNFTKPMISKYLIRRETDGVELAAPPLKPLRPLKALEATASLGAAALDDCKDGAEATPEKAMTA